MSCQHSRLELRRQLRTLRMRAMKLHYFAIGLLALTTAQAQDDQAQKPLVIGGFSTQGSVSTGYRFTDVKGYEPKFQELFDLQSGLRLFDFSLFGTNKTGGNRFADNYSFTMSGIGG